MSNGKGEVITPCEQCEYYFNDAAIHCAVHPYGKTSKYCIDWQLKAVSLEEESLMNSDLEVKTFCRSKAIAISLNVAFMILCGFGVYQCVKSIANGSERYNKYNQEGKVFLEKAGRAGTIGIAQNELEVAVNWLKINYSTQTFEYKDLRANLEYLKKQPKYSLVPTAIKDSVKQNSIAIETTIEKEETKRLFAPKSIFKLTLTGLAAFLLTLSVSTLFVVFQADSIDE